eukprot:11319550-Alexandrium_andersonii.AAC.1
MEPTNHPVTRPVTAASQADTRRRAARDKAAKQRQWRGRRRPRGKAAAGRQRRSCLRCNRGGRDILR